MWRPPGESYEPSLPRPAIAPIDWDKSPWPENCKSKSIRQTRVVVSRSPPIGDSLMHDAMNIVRKLDRKRTPRPADSEDADADEDADGLAVRALPREDEAVPVDE